VVTPFAGSISKRWSPSKSPRTHTFAKPSNAASTLVLNDRRSEGDPSAGADAYHQVVAGDAAEHVAVEHKGDAAEHLAFGQPRTIADDRADAVREGFAVGHQIVLCEL
jgi:hypothetical protein